MAEERKDEGATVRLVGGMDIPKMQAIIDTSKIPSPSMPNLRLVGLPDRIEQRGAPIPQLQTVSSTPGTSTGSDQASNVQNTPSAGDSSGSKENISEK